MRPGSLLLLVLLAWPSLAGCVAPAPAAACDDGHLIRDAVGHFSRIARPDGGIPARAGIAPDAKTTAWVLLATALARRSGSEGGFDPEPHLAYLQAHLPELLAEETAIDSAANDLSLARAAFQAWGRRPAGIPLADPAHPDVTSLAQAWDARYDNTTGRYGTRLNEHLFGAFAAWIFDPPGGRIERMGAYVGDARRNPALREEGVAAYTFDSWWTGYARSALGPGPANRTLARALDVHLATMSSGGGTIGFASGSEADASSTAAAIVGRLAAERRDEDAHDRAVTFLCRLQKPTGQVRFSATREFAQTKTTAEVVIALALWREPIIRDLDAAPAPHDLVSR